MKYFPMMLLAVSIGAVRFLIPTTGQFSPVGSYQAVAHLFVGFLIGGAVFAVGSRWFYAILAGGLSAVELVAFLMKHGV